MSNEKGHCIVPHQQPLFKLGLTQERVRARRTVETVFGVLTLLCAACALAGHYSGEWLPIPPSARQPVAMAFLMLSLVDFAAMMLASVLLSRRKTGDLSKQQNARDAFAPRAISGPKDTRLDLEVGHLGTLAELGYEPVRLAAAAGPGFRVIVWVLILGNAAGLRF